MPTTYYVDPVAGSDAHAGGTTTPWATLAHANSSSADGDTIKLRSGFHYVASQITLAHTNQTWTNDSGHKPVISGGVAITGWILYNEGNNIWRAAYSSTVFRTLWLGNRRYWRSRILSPSIGTLDPATGIYSGTSGLYDDDPNPMQIEFVYHFSWQQSRHSIKSIDSTTITLGTGLVNQMTFFESYFGSQPDPYRVENVAAQFFDEPTPGTFYLDVAGEYVYLIPYWGDPTPDQTGVDVHVGILESVLAASSKTLTISGIAFSHSQWLQPATTQGLIEHQANTYIPSGGAPDVHRVQPKPPGFIDVAATNLTVTGCVFKNLGTPAIDLDGATSAFDIHGNNFYDNSSNHIQIGDSSEFPTTLVVAGLIENNTMTHNGREYESAVPVLVFYSQNLSLSNNAIAFCNWAGMNFGWGWSTETSGTDAGNNTIQANYVSFCLIGEGLNDSGGIYTAGKSTPDLIDSNVVSHTYYDTIGGIIYLDAGATLHTVSNNALYAGQDVLDFARSNSAGTNTWDNNYSENDTVANVFGIDIITNNHKSGNPLYAAEAAASIVSGAGLEEAYAGLYDYPFPERLLSFGSGVYDTNVFGFDLNDLTGLTIQTGNALTPMIPPLLFAPSTPNMAVFGSNGSSLVETILAATDSVSWGAAQQFSCMISVEQTGDNTIVFFGPNICLAIGTGFTNLRQLAPSDTVVVPISGGLPKPKTLYAVTGIISATNVTVYVRDVGTGMYIDSSRNPQTTKTAMFNYTASVDYRVSSVTNAIGTFGNVPNGSSMGPCIAGPANGPVIDHTTASLHPGDTYQPKIHGFTGWATSHLVGPGTWDSSSGTYTADATGTAYLSFNGYMDPSENVSVAITIAENLEVSITGPGSVTYPTLASLTYSGTAPFADQSLTVSASPHGSVAGNPFTLTNGESSIIASNAFHPGNVTENVTISGTIAGIVVDPMVIAVTAVTPSVPSPSISAFNNTTLDVSWSTVTIATSYQVKVFASDGTTLLQGPITVAAPTTTLQITGLSNGTTYKIQARTTADAQSSAYSSLITGITSSPLQAGDLRSGTRANGVSGTLEVGGDSGSSEGFNVRGGVFDSSSIGVTL